MPTRHRSRTDALAACGDDRFADTQLPEPGRWDAATFVAGEGTALAWVWQQAERGRRAVAAVGDAREAAPLVASVMRAAGLDPCAAPLRVTLPRGAAALLPEGLRVPDPVAWDFLWTDARPTLRVPDGTSWLRPDEEPEVEALLVLASPTASAHPGDGRARRWCGLREPDGRLLAVAADTSRGDEVGETSSVATLPEARGRGLGAAVTAWLTTAFLDEGRRFVALGMYADNDVARRMYRRLGYRDDHPFESGLLVPS